MKPKISSEWVYFWALVGDAIACSLMTRANLGVSTMTALPLVLSEVIPLSVGMLSFLIQTILLVILISVTRQPKWTYLMSFLMSFAYGVFFDFFNALFQYLPYNPFSRVLMYLVGFVVLCLIMAMYYVTELPLMPYNAFVADMCRFKDWKVSKVKTGLDVGFLVLTIFLSLIICHGLVGIGVGTVLNALFTGTFQQKGIDWIYAHYQISAKSKVGQRITELAALDK